MLVLVVEPGKTPYTKDIPEGLEALQEAVGGLIQVVYPFTDLVGIICNDEGKLDGLPLNRALRDECGQIYDVIAGTFLVVGLGDENFISLSTEMAEKYSAYFRRPPHFIKIDGEIHAVEEVTRLWD